jgi:TusA-related sulfurtransferase
MYSNHLLPFITEAEISVDPLPATQTDPLEEGLKALEKLDHTTQINVILAYNKFKDNIGSFLKSFAEEGKVVTARDIEKFYEVPLTYIENTRRASSQTIKEEMIDLM